jgi:hypothetical protein
MISSADAKYSEARKKMRELQTLTKQQKKQKKQQKKHLSMQQKLHGKMLKQK